MRPSGGACLSPAPGLSSSVRSVAVTLAYAWHCVCFSDPDVRAAAWRTRTSGETSAGMDGSQTPRCSFNVIYLWFVVVFLVQWSIEPPPPPTQSIHANVYIFVKWLFQRLNHLFYSVGFIKVTVKGDPFNIFAVLLMPLKDLWDLFSILSLNLCYFCPVESLQLFH